MSPCRPLSPPSRSWPLPVSGTDLGPQSQLFFLSFFSPQLFFLGAPADSEGALDFREAGRYLSVFSLLKSSSWQG